MSIWTLLSPNYEWIARDRDGSWRAYRAKPVYSDLGYWWTEIGDSPLLTPALALPTGGPDLRQRPAPWWADVHHWAKWVAQDASGAWCGYEFRPTWEAPRWRSEGWTIVLPFNPPYDGEPEDSLMERPQ